MSVNPVTLNVPKITFKPSTQKNDVAKEPQAQKSPYTGSVSIDSNNNLKIATWIPCSFDSDHWYTLSPDGTVQSMSCWSIGEDGPNTYKSDELKDLYDKVLKDYQAKGSIEGEGAAEISKQIDDIIKSIPEKQ